MTNTQIMTMLEKTADLSDESDALCQFVLEAKRYARDLNQAREEPSKRFSVSWRELLISVLGTFFMIPVAILIDIMELNEGTMWGYLVFLSIFIITNPKRRKNKWIKNEKKNRQNVINSIYIDAKVSQEAKCGIRLADGEKGVLDSYNEKISQNNKLIYDFKCQLEKEAHRNIELTGDTARLFMRYMERFDVTFIESCDMYEKEVRMQQEEEERLRRIEESKKLNKLYTDISNKLDDIDSGIARGNNEAKARYKEERFQRTLDRINRL